MTINSADPWVKWRDVPDGVPYREATLFEARPSWWWVNRNGLRRRIDAYGSNFPSGNTEESMQLCAPFVEVTP